jgi:hypothetical protein
MALAASKPQAPPTVWTWILVTMLWGTVFFGTSTFMLRQAVGLLKAGTFDPSFSEALRVYGLFIGVLLVVALGSMLIKNLIDPGSAAQTRRFQDVAAGRRERLFVSLAGSIATSFIFTVLAALTYAVAAPFLGAAVSLPVTVVAAAAGMNVGAGLAASLLVGIIFIVAKAVKRQGSGFFPESNRKSAFCCAFSVCTMWS